MNSAQNDCLASAGWLAPLELEIIIVAMIEISAGGAQALSLSSKYLCVF